ncbi:unnamed protein product [Vitrella brassicaformis CCMP3155]|uniref:Uncharacterized protein n=1 Tax=Vitrella brassicaformis (strain CCMP3155) TaxID=1169540 RepID=A0A0G4H4L5_VITBC|nr:unnamed protein product [Vitrella brassicaformis CCMP3155]|eukprot:CEM38466.1 unnamed protein product [Vitrella brassicaformis CCMP3155]
MIAAETKNVRTGNLKLYPGQRKGSVEGRKGDGGKVEDQTHRTYNASASERVLDGVSRPTVSRPSPVATQCPSNPPRRLSSVRGPDGCGRPLRPRAGWLRPSDPWDDPHLQPRRDNREAQPRGRADSIRRDTSSLSPP